MQSARGRGRPTQVDKNLLIERVIAHSSEITLQQGKIVSKSARVWDEISLELNHKIAGSSLHSMVCNNKYKLRDKISASSTCNNSLTSEAEPNNDSRSLSQNDTTASDNHEGVSRTYTVKMPRESFQAITEIKKYKRTNKSFRVTTVLVAGVWEDVIMDEIVKQTPVTCGYNFKNHFISNDSKSGYINASCKCGGTARIIIKDEDPKGDDVCLICTCTKGAGKCGKRWLRGAKRAAVAKEISTQPVHIYRANKAEEMMQEDECEPPNLYSSPVLRVAKHEFIAKQYLDRDPVKAVQLQKATIGANVIHNIGLDPFYVHYWTNYQVDIFRRYASKNKTVLCIDATGSIIKKILKPEHGDAGPIFLYHIIMNTDEGQFSVSNMLSERHNTNAIQYWLMEWVRSGAPRPDEVVVDSSKALLNAVIRAFTSCTSINEYADACYGSKIPPCYVRIDVAHFLKLYSDFLKTLPERIKVFYRAAIGQLIMCRSLGDAEKVLEAIFLVALCETEGLLSNGTQSDSENAKILLKKLISEENAQIHEMDDINPGLDEFRVRTANEDDDDDAVGSLDHLPKWKKWGTDIQKRVRLVAASQTGDRENAHYFPSLANKLTKDVANIPLWSCLARDKFGYGRVPATSAPVEGEFNIIKTHLLKNETLPIRVDRFLNLHINYMGGRTKLIGAKLIQNEDVAADNQCNNAEIATTAVDHYIDSNSPDRDLEQVLSGHFIEIEEDSRILNEVAQQTRTEVECPACQNNDKPSGAHKCIICNIPIHALELCSIALDNEEEGYGQKRVCLQCNSTGSVPLILTTRDEENWRGLTLKTNKPNKKQRKISKYLGGQKHKIKEKLIFEKNKKLPLIKNGSHGSLHALTVDGKKVYVTYTCGFDSVYQIMLAAFCDTPDLREMVEQRGTRTDLFDMVFDVLDNGFRASSYRNRAKILFNQFPSELGACGSFVVDCSTGLPALVRRLFQNAPSFTELVVCNNGCDPEISTRTVPIINVSALCVEKINIADVLQLPRVCNVPECGGSVSTNISAIGPIVIFEVFSASGNTNVKLQDLSREFTNPVTLRGTYKLIGVIHEIVPRTRHSNSKDMSHYTGFCLRTDGSWEEYDDNKKNEIGRRDQTEVRLTLIMYAQSNKTVI